MSSLLNGTNLLLKRLIDIVGSVCALVILSPLIIVSSILLLIESGWPIIYSHKRVGRDNKEFSLYKIRTMVTNADEILWNQNPKLLEEYRSNGYKLKNDPRITRVGKIIRRLDIDETPQFVNVLKGDMSLVGPRAYKKNELSDQSQKNPDSKKYIEEALTVKPGITGLWQISGRNSVSFKERIRYDADYAKSWNILKDITILLKTPFAVLRNHGD